MERAAADARAWVRDLGPAWIARFDQMQCEVRAWAVKVGVDPGSTEFRAAWCVASTFLHRMAALADGDDPDGPVDLKEVANIVATVGLWGSPPATGPVTR